MTVKPFDRPTVEANYEGLYVSWPARLLRLEKDSDSWFVSFQDDGDEEFSFVVVSAHIDITKHPKLKIVDHGQRCWIEGRVKNVHGEHLWLEDDPQITIY